MLKYLGIRRFKNIEDIDIHLERVNIVVGANNSGKSSILQAIQFAVAIAQTTSIENIRWKGDRLPTSLSHLQLIYSPLRDVSALAMGGNLQESEEQAIVINFEELETNNKAMILIKRGRNRNITVAIEGKDLGLKLQVIEEPFSIYVPGLAGIPVVEEYKNPGIVRKAAARGDANNVFRNILWLLKQSSSGWSQFLEDFYFVFPDKPIDVNFTPDRDDYISCTVDTNGKKLPIDSAGTGVLQAVQILSYVNLYKPKILILDEPDAHLHPNNQRRLAQMLVTLSERRNFQVILTTHSRHLLDELAGSAKVHWIRNGKLAEEENFDEVKVLMEIGALDKGDRLRSGNTKCVLLTEDTDTKPIETLLEASGFRLDAVDVWSYKGCSKVDTALVLAAFIKEHAPGTKILLHRDRDYLSTEEAEDFRRKVEVGNNIECFITNGTDTESHFLSHEHINSLYRNVSLERAAEFINAATQSAKDKSIEKFINTRSQLAQEAYYRSGGSKNRPNQGRLSTSAMGDYEQDVVQYRHGKSVLGHLKNALQREVGGNINLFQVTTHIAVQELQEIASRIWNNS